MRWIMVAFFLGSLALFGGEPSEAALKFLGEIKTLDRSVMGSENLAISAFCGPEKKKMIEARWQSRATWLRSMDFELFPFLEKVDENLAAVLIGARSKVSPEVAGVIALGLVKKGDQWELAPLEGSFDNTGLGYGAEIEKRVLALEEWLVLEKIEGTIRITEQERARFRKSMEGVVEAEKLKIEDSREVLLEFLEAGHAGETEKLLVWQGLLEREQLPDRDWDRDIRATRSGMSNEDLGSAWRTLKSNKVMKVIVEENGSMEEANYLVAFFSTFKTNPRNEQLNPVRFEMFMTDHGWRIKLPAFFAYDEEELGMHLDFFSQEFDWEDRRSANELAYVFEDDYDPIRSATPQEMLEGVVANLKSGSLHLFLQRHYRELEGFEDEDDEEEAAILPKRHDAVGDIDSRRMERYQEALAWWGGALGKGETMDATIKKVYQEGDLALGILQSGLNHDGWKQHYVEIWMAKGEDGWMLLPGSPEPLGHSIAPSLVETRVALSKKYAIESRKFREEHLEELLKGFGLDDPAGKAIDEAGGRKVVEEWSRAASKGSMTELAAKSAYRVQPDDPDKFLRDLGYLRAAAAASQVPDRFLGSIASGRYRAFSLMVDAGEGIEPSFPLAIVVPTEVGYRLLGDIELPLETNKGIRILNETRIKGYADELSEGDLASIKELREWHQKVARPVWEKWNLDQALKDQ